jgi:hypothetical protein
VNDEEKERLFREAGYQGARTVRLAMLGLHDTALEDQLNQLDAEWLLLSMRLPDQQAAAVTKVLTRIAESFPVDLDPAERGCLLNGLSYGFTLGHDYVARHGSLTPRPCVE